MGVVRARRPLQITVTRESSALERKYFWFQRYLVFKQDKTELSKTLYYDARPMNPLWMESTDSYISKRRYQQINWETDQRSLKVSTCSMRNNMITNRNSINGKLRKKSKFQMGFDPATLRDLEEHSNCTELIITCEKFKHWQRLNDF